MTPILYLIGLSLLLGGGGLVLFLWASRTGQYDDMDGAANRILFDDKPGEPPPLARSQPARPQPARPYPEKR